MDQFLRNLYGLEGEAMDPFVFAAWIHHAFVDIHPFTDGNGRVSRWLASLVLIKNRLPPLVVELDDYMDYSKALDSANQGDLTPLVNFMQRCVKKTIGGIREGLLQTNAKKQEL